jgi:hypothetical protein
MKAHPMPPNEPFHLMLTGGHPNSLGRTVEVVELIAAAPALLEQLYACYFSDDEVVRLRTSNAFKRIWREHPDWLIPYLDRFLAEISQIDQASTRWTLAQMFLELERLLSPDQKTRAIAVLKRNLDESNDWIVINETLKALGKWAKEDTLLRDWLKPYLLRFGGDNRKSVAKNANTVYKTLYRD